MKLYIWLLVCMCVSSVFANPEALPFDPGAVVQSVTRAQGGNPRAFPPDTIEFMLDTVPSGYSRIPDPAFAPAVASNGTDYLVVWKEHVVNFPVYGARVSGSGQLLDSSGFLICAVTHDARRECAAVWGDTSYFVVWPHQSWSIRGALVSGEGQVRPGVVVVADSTVSHLAPALAFDGRRFVVAWHASSYNSRRWDIRYARVETDGTVLEPMGRVLHRGISHHHTHQRASVAASTQMALVVWEGDRIGHWQVLGARIDSSGVPLDTAGFPISFEGYGGQAASVAFGGEDFLVCWSTGEEALSDIVAARVTPEGIVLDRPPITLCGHTHAQEEPSVAFDGTNYMVAWQDWRNGNRDVYGTRVTPTGDLLDPDGVRWTSNPQDETEPAIAVGDRACLVAWLDFRWPNDADVFAMRVGPSGTVLDSAFPVPDTQDLVPEFDAQFLPDVAFNGDCYLVVWEDHRTENNQWDVYGMRVSPDGVVLDSASFVISDAAEAQQCPAVAFGDSTFLVVWEDSRNPQHNYDIYGARVNRDGVVLDPQGIAIMPRYHYSERSPALAYDGSKFLVVWHTFGVTALLGRFVDEAGRPMGDSFMLLHNGLEIPAPSVVFGDSCYLAAWHGVHAVRVSVSGVPLDSLSIRPGTGTMPALSFDGGEFCCVWRGYNPTSVLLGSRITQQGQVLDSGGVALRSAGSNHEWPDLAFNGRNYVMAWQENFSSYDWTLYGARVEPALVGVDTFRLSWNPGRDQTPAVACGPANQSFIVFACTTAASLAHGAQAYRVWGRFHEDDSSPVPTFPPALLWPPDGYEFLQLPVELLVDSMRPELDTFDFRVMIGGDTLWRYSTTSPRCTVPDAVIIEGAMHRWTCRTFDDSLWSMFSVPWRFEYVPLGVQDGTPPALSGASRATVFRRQQTLRLGARSGGSALSRLEVYATDGRRVAAFEPQATGDVRWDWRDQSGRPVGTGIYILRLTDAMGRTSQSKVVLVD